MPKTLQAITSPPDLIHGQNHFETMLAMLEFSHTPAVFTCHGWSSWKNAPPLFPRIRRYLPVDDTCRDRLVLECGVADDQVEIHHNFVDLSRFALRTPLPLKPSRAFLFFRKVPNEYVSMFRTVCERYGISLDVLGEEQLISPEQVLSSYDLVFARGRSAIEAMACETAVVLTGLEGAGPLVTASHFDELRRLNFGLRAFQRPLALETIAAAVSSYDAADAAVVSQRIRAEAGLARAVSRLVDTYDAVISESSSSLDCEREERAVAVYLIDTRRYFEYHRTKFVDKRLARLRERMRHLRDALDKQRLEARESRQEAKEHRNLARVYDREKAKQAKAQIQGLKATLAKLQNSRTRYRQERDDLRGRFAVRVQNRLTQLLRGRSRRH